jgi:predicted dehydrogenase
VRIGVIGAGAIARRHVASLRRRPQMLDCAGHVALSRKNGGQIEMCPVEVGPQWPTQCDCSTWEVGS